MICEPWSVVVVPFPFAADADKKRPAVVLTKRLFNESGSSVLAMITTRSQRAWAGDSEIEDHETAGLPEHCIIRLKIFTLDNRLILKQIGRLAERDRKRASGNVSLFLI